MRISKKDRYHYIPDRIISIKSRSFLSYDPYEGIETDQPIQFDPYILKQLVHHVDCFEITSYNEPHQKAMVKAIFESAARKIKRLYIEIGEERWSGLEPF